MCTASCVFALASPACHIAAAASTANATAAGGGYCARAPLDYATSLLIVHAFLPYIHTHAMRAIHPLALVGTPLVVMRLERTRAFACATQPYP